MGLNCSSARRALASMARTSTKGCPRRIDLGHQDVLGDTYVRAERDLLMHEADPQLLSAGGRGDLDRPTVEDNLAAVGL